MDKEARQLAARIRAASPRRELPLGIQTRIMAQIRLRERRRRERRAIAEMGLYCLGISVVLSAVALLGLRTIDPQHDLPSLLFLFCGLTGIGLTAFNDRIDKLWRRL